MKFRKTILVMLLVVAVLAMTGCSGKGSAKGVNNSSTKIIYDINDSSNYCKFNTSKGTVTVVLYEDVEGIGEIDLSSKKAVKYNGTYKAGNTVSFTYNCKFDGTPISVSIKIPKSGNKATINYSY